jgi:hypothetical protein
MPFEEKSTTGQVKSVLANSQHKKHYSLYKVALAKVWITRWWLPA